MGVVVFLWNVLSFACVAVVQPITREVTLPAEFGVGHFEDRELRRLASFLPAVLVQDRVTSTAATYFRAYKSWKTWAEQHSASYLPADSVVLTLYIVSLMQQSCSGLKITNSRSPVMMTGQIFLSPELMNTIIIFLPMEYRITLAVDRCTALSFRFLPASW